METKICQGADGGKQMPRKNLHSGVVQNRFASKSMGQRNPDKKTLWKE